MPTLYVDQQTDVPDELGCSHEGCERPAFSFSFGESREKATGYVTACWKHARPMAEAAQATTPRAYPVAVWTGPGLAETVAAFLRGLAYDAKAGTERAYFRVQACSRDEAHYAALEAVRKFSRTFMPRDVSVSQAY